MKIELTGYNIDNLLKILYRKKITIFNLKRIEHNKISFDIKDCDHKKVKRYIGNFKVKETLSYTKRLPKLIVANLGIVLGVFIGTLFGIFASNYTWQIHIYGTEELSNQDILDVLEENNIKKGKINHQTSEEIENILLTNYNRIAQVSVIKKGTAIIINLSEKLVYTEQTYEPIVATYSGIIKDIKIITGTANIKVGDYVHVGDMLVLPFNINADGTKVYVKPLAEIKAEMFVVGKCEMKQHEEVLIRTGKTFKTYNYKFKSKNLFSSKSKNSFALFEVDMYNENISDLLPLSRDVLVHYELTPTIITHDFEKEKDSLILKSKLTAKQNLPAGEILSQNTETHIVEDVMFSTTTITVFGIINN